LFDGELMEDLSLHILDIAENSLKAGARKIAITIREDAAADQLTLEVSDDGKGMDAAVAAQAMNPFFTTGTTRRVGLGLPLLSEAATVAGGRVDIRSVPGKGTSICATFRLSHIDRKPLGNMAETIAALIAGRPELDLTYRHDRDGGSVLFTTATVRERLGGVPLNSAAVLHFVMEYLTQEENCLPHHG
jgi:anti-sigma regulatory factor (Ser/Thr protein kinase)